MKKVVEEVTVFIHCAATISFTEPLLDAINQNVVAALRVLKIAKSAKRVKIFTHVSTAYVGCNRYCAIAFTITGHVTRQTN